MSINLETHTAPHPQPKPKLELPPVVRDYLEHVRGNPEINRSLPLDYLDRLWSQANEFAEGNGLDCPVHQEEVEALRAAVEARMAASRAALSGQWLKPSRHGGHRLFRSC